MAKKKNNNSKGKKRKKPIQKRVIRAAGGLLWRETERGKELALVHRPRYDDWVLPKGHIDKGESWEDTAVREVVEETCCEAKLGDYAGSISYLVNNKPKIVLFWHMSLSGEPDFIPNNETDQMLWLTPAEAVEKLAYGTERTLVSQNQE
ncbi:MAG: NUDIX hydrolase [Candidatus Promineifilaceae bacterium]